MSGMLWKPRVSSLGEEVKLGVAVSRQSFMQSLVFTSSLSLQTLCLGGVGLLDAVPPETAQMKCPWFWSPASTKGLECPAVILEFDFWKQFVRGDLHAQVLCSAEDKRDISYSPAQHCGSESCVKLTCTYC